MSADTPELPDVNADLARPARVDAQAMDWEASPSGTVWRKPLFRAGGEFGPVTSVVRYGAGGAFRPHAHPQGEEILVLAGVFADEHGEYPAGTWFLNPDGSTHAPRSEVGCDLFVRLRQYPGAERAPRCLDTRQMPWVPTSVPGMEEKVLYREAGYPEEVVLLRLADGAELPSPGGRAVEVLVLEGRLESAERVAGEGFWLREPAHTDTTWRAVGQCILYRRLNA